MIFGYFKGREGSRPAEEDAADFSWTGETKEEKSNLKRQMDLSAAERHLDRAHELLEMAKADETADVEAAENLVKQREDELLALSSNAKETEH
ncbi:MAG: hypothetical protein R3B41_02175 [Candidatus Doudnabacteria bacterium]